MLPMIELEWEERITPAADKEEQREVKVTLRASPNKKGIFGSPEQVAILLSKGVQKLVLERKDGK